MLKKEIRILGLSATTGKKHRSIVVGVVFRGSLWLDGMAMCSLQAGRRDHTLRISRAVIGSRQYSQLHAVVLSREPLAPGVNIDVAELVRRLRLPVITFVRKRQVRKKRIENSKASRYHILMNGKRISVLASRISLEGVQDVLAVACARDSLIPEAARVADVIAEQVTLKWSSLGLR